MTTTDWTTPRFEIGAAPLPAKWQQFAQAHGERNLPDAPMYMPCCSADRAEDSAAALNADYLGLVMFGAGARTGCISAIYARSTACWAARFICHTGLELAVVCCAAVPGGFRHRRPGLAGIAASHSAGWRTGDSKG